MLFVVCDSLCTALASDCRLRLLDFPMSLIVILLRIALSAVFGVAGVTKLLDLNGTREAVKNFGAPAPLVPALSFLLPVLELAIAAGLLVDSATPSQARSAHYCCSACSSSPSALIWRRVALTIATALGSSILVPSAGPRSYATLSSPLERASSSGRRQRRRAASCPDAAWA